MAITQASEAEATNKAASQSMEISPITEAHQTFYTIEDDCTQSQPPLHASSSRTSAASWSNGLSFDTDGSKIDTSAVANLSAHQSRSDAYLHAEFSRGFWNP